jgi:hypothetical protein
MCIDEATKKAAVISATRGTSSSRMRQAPASINPASPIQPATQQGGVSTLSAM